MDDSVVKDYIQRSDPTLERFTELLEIGAGWQKAC